MRPPALLAPREKKAIKIVNPNTKEQFIPSTQETIPATISASVVVPTAVVPSSVSVSVVVPVVTAVPVATVGSPLAARVKKPLIIMKPQTPQTVVTAPVTAVNPLAVEPVSDISVSSEQKIPVLIETDEQEKQGTESVSATLSVPKDIMEGYRKGLWNPFTGAGSMQYTSSFLLSFASYCSSKSSKLDPAFLTQQKVEYNSNKNKPTMGGVQNLAFGIPTSGQIGRIPSRTSSSNYGSHAGLRQNSQGRPGIPQNQGQSLKYVIAAPSAPLLPGENAWRGNKIVENDPEQKVCIVIGYFIDMYSKCLCILYTYT